MGYAVDMDQTVWAQFMWLIVQALVTSAVVWFYTESKFSGILSGAATFSIVGLGMMVIEKMARKSRRRRRTIRRLFSYKTIMWFGYFLLSVLAVYFQYRYWSRLSS